MHRTGYKECVYRTNSEWIFPKINTTPEKEDNQAIQLVMEFHYATILLQMLFQKYSVFPVTQIFTIS